MTHVTNPIFSAYTHEDGWNRKDPIINSLYLNCPYVLEKTKREWSQLSRGILHMWSTGRATHKVNDSVPRDLLAYIHHVVAMKKAAQDAAVRQQELNRVYDRFHLDSKRRPLAFAGDCFGEKRMPDELFIKGMPRDQHPNHPLLSPVLCQLSSWTPWYGSQHEYWSWRERIDWPDAAALDYEGNQRVATENGRFGRFLPLPRRFDGTYSIPYDQKEYVKPWRFDNVWPVPTMPDVYLGAEHIIDEEGSTLLGQELMDALNDDSIPVSSGRIRALLA
jgi:hypothetical protein